MYRFDYQSEERGKDEATKEQSMRAAGSSPCVGADSSFNVRNSVADPEQGIYHGVYRLGMWICITDRDVWHRSDFGFNEGKHSLRNESCHFLFTKCYVYNLMTKYMSLFKYL